MTAPVKVTKKAYKALETKVKEMTTGQKRKAPYDKAEAMVKEALAGHLAYIEQQVEKKAFGPLFNSNYDVEYMLDDLLSDINSDRVWRNHTAADYNTRSLVANNID
jgi:hypothetical protein